VERNFSKNKKSSTDFEKKIEKRNKQQKTIFYKTQKLKNSKTKKATE